MIEKTRVIYVGNPGVYDILIHVRGLRSAFFFTVEEAQGLRNQLGSVIRQIHREEERDEENSN